jgi:hypothetical protein
MTVSNIVHAKFNTIKRPSKQPEQRWFDEAWALFKERNCGGINKAPDVDDVIVGMEALGFRAANARSLLRKENRKRSPDDWYRIINATITNKTMQRVLYNIVWWDWSHDAEDKTPEMIIARNETWAPFFAKHCSVVVKRPACTKIREAVRAIGYTNCKHRIRKVKYATPPPVEDVWLENSDPIPYMRSLHYDM